MNLPSGDNPWNFTTGGSNKLMNNLEKIKLRLLDISKDIFQGLLTGRDKLFFVTIKEDKGDLVIVENNHDKSSHTIEKGILKKLLKGKEIRKWHIDWQNAYSIYPYEEQNGVNSLIPVEKIKTKYPYAYQYFVHYKTELMSSDTSEAVDDTNWYRCRRARSMEQFEQAKIITQVLASTNSFALDESGKFYFVGGGNAGGFGIILKEEYVKYYPVILALLNSKVLEFYLKKTSTPFESGFYSYGKRFIENFPIVIPEENQVKLLSELSRKQVSFAMQLNELGEKKTEEREQIIAQMKDNESEINDIIFKIYGLDEAEQKIVEDSIK
ncbi:MAG: TaqI-like C-terminal specificity domain-containing protein [Nitrosotalea sp.]